MGEEKKKNKQLEEHVAIGLSDSEKPAKTNMLYTADIRLVITIAILLLGIIGVACVQWGKRMNDGENTALKQTVTRQNQKIQNLTDTILKLKLTAKDTITSMQEPGPIAP